MNFPFCPIAVKIAPPRRATYVANDVAPLKKLRDVPLRYYVAALVCGGISLFLFGVVFALLRQADRIAPNPAWDWVLAALIALIAAVGALFGLLAWGALSDPKSRLGSRFREKSADAVETAGALFIGDAIGWVIGGAIGWAGVSLFFLARSYSSYTGVAAISCGVLILVLVAWRALKANHQSPR